MNDTRARARAGFTILEAVVALAAFAIVLLGLVAVVTSVLRSSRSTVETRAAARALNAAVENLRGHEFDTLFVDYSVTGTPGATFSISDLEAPPDGTPQGEVVFLGETDVLDFLGQNADFDGDGLFDSPAPTSAVEAAGWVALPVLVRVSWRDAGSQETRSAEVRTIIYDQSR